jgi:hypothetical protein
MGFSGEVMTFANCDHSQHMDEGPRCLICLESEKRDIFRLQARFQRALSVAKIRRDAARKNRAKNNRADNNYARKQGFASYAELKASGWMPFRTARAEFKKSKYTVQGDAEQGRNAMPEYAKDNENPFTRHSQPEAFSFGV